MAKTTVVTHTRREDGKSRVVEETTTKETTTVGKVVKGVLIGAGILAVLAALGSAADKK